MKSKLWSGLKQLLSMLFFVTVVSIGVDLWRSQDVPEGELPQLSALSVAGEHIDLQALSKDQPVLLYFWGSWCGVCNFVSPAVNTLSKHFNVVTVALRSGEQAKMQAYLNHHNYQFNVVNDPQSKLGAQWGISVTPTLMVIKNGELKHYTAGFTTLPGMWWRMLMA
ncbi:protein disulfide oxidoreductase [Agarivorans sp. MS3-6]|uniref:protein disulfide oxidoreductase n=1 Tax=Agarivorans sp. TSD2052 TaxID=2937286 RepID=UPI00200DAE6D|nr:protein disulfide oxidoreductase [Agarivorans sp. TSD2052]UPW17478.1 protein disulfide oxidoreductase [Agarivorans sp. TSD2052]